MRDEHSFRRIVNENNDSKQLSASVRGIILSFVFVLVKCAHSADKVARLRLLLAPKTGALLWRRVSEFQSANRLPSVAVTVVRVARALVITPAGRSAYEVAGSVASAAVRLVVLV